MDNEINRLRKETSTLNNNIQTFISKKEEIKTKISNI